MKLSLIHELGAIGEGRRGDNLHDALRFIYGHNTLPMGFARPKLHQAKNAAQVEPGNRALGARQYDQGTPWKLRHRRFFRMGNDGEAGTIRY